MARKRRRQSEEPFQMAPMIDMVFLLLVFFMTVSTIARDSRPDLDLAVSTTAAVPEAAPPRDIVTVRQEDGFQFYWSNRRVEAKEIPGLLHNRNSGGGEILLRAGPETPWEVTRNLLNDCRQANINEVVFATFED